MGLGPDWYQENIVCQKFKNMPGDINVKMEPMELKVLKCKHEIY